MYKINVKRRIKPSLLVISLSFITIKENIKITIESTIIAGTKLVKFLSIVGFRIVRSPRTAVLNVALPMKLPAARVFVSLLWLLSSIVNSGRLVPMLIPRRPINTGGMLIWWAREIDWATVRFDVIINPKTPNTPLAKIKGTEAPFLCLLRSSTLLFPIIYMRKAV